MSCPFCSGSSSSALFNKSQNGSYTNVPYPSGFKYDPPIIDATTEVILDLRRKCINCDSEATRRAKGIYHWSNVPSGDSLSAELNKQFPQIGGKGGCGSASHGGFSECPFCHRSLGSSGFTSSCQNSSRSQSFAQQPQRPTYVPQPPQPVQQVQRPTYVPPPPQVIQTPQRPVYVPPPPRPVQQQQRPLYVPPPQRPVQQQSYQQPCYQQPRGGCQSYNSGYGNGSNKIQQALQHIDQASRILKTC